MLREVLGDVVDILVAAPREVGDDDAVSPSSRASFMAWTMACELSSAGMMPSTRERVLKASRHSSSVAVTYVTRPSDARYACCGPTPG